MAIQIIPETLVASGLLTDEELQLARQEAEKKDRPLAQTLVELKLVGKEALYMVIAEQLGIPYIELDQYLPDPNVLEEIPEDIARQYKALPLFKIRNALTVAMADPTDLMAVDQVSSSASCSVEICLAAALDVDRALEQAYGSGAEVQGLIDSLRSEELRAGTSGLSGSKQESPISKLVDLIITQAVRDRASDIHVEPEEDMLRIRFRIDGVLHEIPSPPKNLELAVISRLKILARLDIAETRVPQDGHMQLEVDGRRIDVRCSTLPTLYGENVVLRILDATSAVHGLENLGFSDEMRKQVEELILKPHGMLLVTGPTGSGKTTTLYSALMRINTLDRNIITVEDPVEYRLGLIRQVQVNTKTGLTFASGLRSILRQDPDVVMVGEIRDQETGLIAVQAALTGHFVFSTLHTNDAPSAVTRLLNMGIENFLISAALSGVIAQRLIRTICDECREAYEPSKALIDRLGLADRKVKFFRGRGCQLCKGTGYRGRLGIYELLVVNDDLREMIIAGASSLALGEAARGYGMKVMREDGLEKVLKGVTTLEEVSRVADSRVDTKPVDAKVRPVSARDGSSEGTSSATKPAELPGGTPEGQVGEAVEVYRQRIMNWLAKQ